MTTTQRPSRKIDGKGRTVREVLAGRKYSIDYYQREYKWQRKHDPRAQIVHGKTVCVVSCQRSPEPVFLKWKGMEASAGGDFFVRSGPSTVKLPMDSAYEYIRTPFPGFARPADSSPECERPGR